MLIRFVGVTSVIMMITILSFGITMDAHALLFYIKPYSGSVNCDAVAAGVGNVNKDPKGINCQIDPLFGEGSIAGLVVCGNPGKKLQKAPGIQLATLEGGFVDFEPIDPKDCDHNGKCEVRLHATPTEEQLTTLDDACPNPNWSALDFVPCAADVKGELLGLDCTGKEVVLAEAVYECTLPNCDTLQWDKGTQTLEERAYECTVISEQQFQTC